MAAHDLEVIDAESRRWVGIIRRLDPYRLCDFIDDIGAEEYLRQWLAAHDCNVRAKALRDAADAMVEHKPIRTSQYDDFGSGREKEFENCIETVIAMADAAENEACNAGA